MATKQRRPTCHSTLPPRQQTRGKEKKLNALPLCANSAHIFTPLPTLPPSLLPGYCPALLPSLSLPPLCPFSLLSLSTQCANNGSALLTQKVALWRQCSPRHSPFPRLSAAAVALFSLCSPTSPTPLGSILTGLLLIRCNGD